MANQHEQEFAKILAEYLMKSNLVPPPVYNPTVDRTGDKIILPEGANLPDVIRALERKHKQEEQQTRIHVTIPVAPWDGANALKKAISAELGLFNQIESWDANVHQIDVEVELGKTVQVPWGTFELPGMEGAQVETNINMNDGRIVFSCTVSCKRRFEPRVRKLLDEVRRIATTESLHKGKAFSIAFHDSDGDSLSMPMPKFFQLSDETPIFRRDLQNSIDRNVLVPIKFASERKALGKSLKRGVLFAGEYGVGKTLMASYIAKHATRHGWTFIYVKNPVELPQALRWAVQYQPVIVFAEDVDRLAGLERTEDVNKLLNQLDGIDGKATDIITILTSNFADKINPAMRRPGRIDLIVPVLSPDADTVIRLIKEFAGDTLEEYTDLSAIGALLAGEIPARIRETVSRAELEANRRTGNVHAQISANDIEAVAHEVKAEGELFKVQPTKDNALATIAEGFTAAGKTMNQALNGNPAYS